MNKLLIILFTAITTVILYNESEDHFSTRVFISSSLIIFFSILKIFSRPDQPYSLEKIFFLFALFFFGIAPLLQYYDYSSFFGSRQLAESEYFFMNILVILILICYSFFYYVFSRFKINKKIYFKSQRYFIHQVNFQKQLILILIASLSFAAVFYANNYNLISLFIRSGEFKEASVENTSLYLIIFRFLQPLSMMVLLYLISAKAKKSILFIVAFIAVLTCFPTGMARFSAAALYLPLILLTIPSFRRKNQFSFFMVFSLLIVFPFLNQFRNFSSSRDIKLGFDFSMFTEGHFDSYQNFTLIVSENIITYGNQLAGVILFWLPRSVWPGKPIGSGAFTAEKLDFYFTNVSANFFAEGYINFGFLGIILFTLLLSFFTAQLDKLYWSIIIFQPNNFSKIFYLVLLGMLFFMLRGDLMSSFAFTLGLLFSALLVFKISRNP